jgi:hypothetical protein
LHPYTPNAIWYHAHGLEQFQRKSGVVNIFEMGEIRCTFLMMQDNITGTDNPSKRYAVKSLSNARFDGDGILFGVWFKRTKAGVEPQLVNRFLTTDVYFAGRRYACIPCDRTKLIVMQTWIHLIAFHKHIDCTQRTSTAPYFGNSLCFLSRPQVLGEEIVCR